MSVVVRIDEIGAKLAAYQEQMATLAGALAALKQVADLINAGLEADRLEMSAIGRDIGLQALASFAAGQQDGDTAEAVGPISAADDTYEGVDHSINEQDSAIGSGYEVTLIEEAQDEAAVVHAPVETIADAAEGAVDSAPAWLEDNLDAAETAEVVAPADVAEPSQQAVAEAPASAETTAADDKADTERMISQIAAAASEGKVVDLAQHRDNRAAVARPSRRRAIGIVAAFAIAMAGTAGMQEFLQSDTAQQFIGLASCDAEGAAVSRDCAMLAWLLL